MLGEVSRLFLKDFEALMTGIEVLSEGFVFSEIIPTFLKSERDHSIFGDFEVPITVVVSVFHHLF